MNYRTPVKQARGLGSAHEGAAHWWAQRVSAVALIPLGLWFAVSVIGLLAADYDTAVNWMSQPWNAVLMSIFLGVMFYHSWLGVQVVVEDYVHLEWLKLVTLFVVQFAHFLLAAYAIFVVLRLAF